ncbi:aminodeoxychorismate synthase component I [Herbaspirillum lusitanum]|uniref:aminodeoxychorismate synthase component I n=1 Tax=Herbaspirillum lusitanum TaxID=213312 RepID=UPI002237E6E6|nr:aminodeoxychorismate synthase component I [Herbaspirillum lusitanum]MCW5298201.1 aminodeoxychorismate synthase component I [Herbaspirillum lusitanum]
MSLPCFALLDDSYRHDDANARTDEPRSRLYTGYHATLRCHDANGMEEMLARMQNAQQQGLHAVALFSYELGGGLHGIEAHADQPGPLAEILLFTDCRRLSATQTDEWLQQQDAVPAAAGVANVRASVDEQRFSADIARIRDYIAAGDTYQVNYTYRLQFDAWGKPLSLYKQLRARQPVPYGALIHLPDQRWVLSFSPELFVRHAQGKLLAQPMKGTAPAHDDAAEDSRRADQLANDEKNRAENLMIVDLLRNDLGRVAVAGSVQVPHLFTVGRFGQVLQMTSTVTAQLRDDVQLADVVAALYPCGSITGAPKRRTMQIIRELESAPRGLYTGAIGWFDAAPAERTLGDFCLSVPIRTLVLQAPQHGVRRGEMGVGAGIVHDSKAADEFAECRLKSSFLTGLDSGFSLFETIHADHENGCRHLDLHLQRLQNSAAYFNFTFDETIVRNGLTDACAQLPPATPHRLRLDLFRDGAIRLQQGALSALDATVKVFVSPTPSASHDLFLRHKTSVRTAYDDAWKEAERRGGFDMLFFNERDQLTEGGRSNVFVQLDGRWYTPPLAAGALPGVMRSVLLRDPAWAATERSITREELRHADAVMICNALRGAVRAEVVWNMDKAA